jgi:nicotinamide mononucleotide transporter
MPPLHTFIFWCGVQEEVAGPRWRPASKPVQVPNTSEAGKSTKLRPPGNLNFGSNRSLLSILESFLEGLRNTTWYEYVAVISGIASVWFSRKESILVYPVGLINTILYIWISVEGDLFGEASVNLYYTIMSFYGWFMWSRRDTQLEKKLHISYSDKKWWIYQFAFFAACYLILFFSLTWLQKNFAPGAIPWADAFASASAFTGMWLMTRKKVESWYWWIATNVASIPLYFVKDYMVTAVYYLILLFMAFWGLSEWKKRAQIQSRRLA